MQCPRNYEQTFFSCVSNKSGTKGFNDRQKNPGIPRTRTGQNGFPRAPHKARKKEIPFIKRENIAPRQGYNIFTIPEWNPRTSVEPPCACTLRAERTVYRELLENLSQRNARIRARPVKRFVAHATAILPVLRESFTILKLVFCLISFL